MLAAYIREDGANAYVDEFIKRHCPEPEEDEMMDIDVKEHDRNQFVIKCKENPVSIKNARGEAVEDRNGAERKGYKVEDKEGKRMRFIWVEVFMTEG